MLTAIGRARSVHDADGSGTIGRGEFGKMMVTMFGRVHTLAQSSPAEKDGPEMQCGPAAASRGAASSWGSGKAPGEAAST